MKKLFVVLLMACMPLAANAAGGGAHLDSFEADLDNKASLQRGMQTFVNNCMGCHSAKFQRYERTAEAIGISPELMQEHLVLGEAKVGEQMTIAMSPEDGANWFGNPPPDLSLETRLRGSDWVYTYLRSFYKDESRPYGVNNVVFKDVGMPNVLESLQGVQVAHCDRAEMEAHGIHGDEIDPLTNKPVNSCVSIEAGTGSLSVEEFDRVIYDLVNFLTYVGNPNAQDSQRIGTYVLIFLFFFFFLAYALKKEFWRDVH